MRCFIALIALLLLSWPAEAAGNAKKGVWVSVVEEKNVLYDTADIDKLIEFSHAHGFDTLFVQVYRANKAWFPSQVADETPFQDVMSRAGQNTLAYLIREAHEKGIEVHAWVNTLSIAQNQEAPILTKYGKGVLTRDQNGRLPFVDHQESKNKRFETEKQLFLEPGDKRVREHLSQIVREIASGFPGLDGIHFDYIRYPTVLPAVPGSRFNYVGLSYGYGEYNIKAFEEATGVNPRKVSGQRLEARLWDRWKRSQVTGLLRDMVEAAREENPHLQFSCAVTASVDRFYEGASQDWPHWIEKGLVDYVVVMNYTEDERRFRLVSEASLGLSKDPRKVYMGIGAYLLEDKPMEFDRMRQITDLLPAGGVVFFNYTSLSREPLIDHLEDKDPRTS